MNECKDISSLDAVLIYFMYLEIYICIYLFYMVKTTHTVKQRNKKDREEAEKL